MKRKENEKERKERKGKKKLKRSYKISTKYLQQIFVLNCGNHA